jgi:hypothetical protein
VIAPARLVLFISLRTKGVHALALKSFLAKIGVEQMSIQGRGPPYFARACV